MYNLKQTLIKLFALDKMEPEKAKRITEGLAELVFQQVLMQELPSLSETDLEKYDALLEKKEDPEILFDFLKEKIPNFENLLLAEASHLPAELVSKAKTT